MACFLPSSRAPGPIRLEDSLSNLDIGEKSINLEFPTYDTLDGSEELEQRLKAVKNEIQDANVDWYIVPSEDEHQSEGVGDSEKRRQYISGFTGSAGTALIPSSTSQSALLFVDSRYWIQAEQQVPKGWKVVRVGSSSGGGSGRADAQNGWVDWIVNELEEGSRVGIDPKLISLDLVRSIRSRLSSIDSSITLVPLSTNLIDKIRNVPARSLGPINPYPLALSGEDTPSKLSRARKAITEAVGGKRKGKAEEWVYILPTLPAIAWLLNYRCPSDIPFCPVAYAYLVLTPSQCAVFVDKRKVENELNERWKGEDVEVRDYGVEEVGKFVKAFVGGDEEKRKVRVFSPAECSWALAKACSPHGITTITCPIDILKAVKNPVEQQNFRNAYLRDGRAMVRWLAWLEKMLLKDERKVGEWAAAQGLTRERRKEDYFAGLAYEDISASGPNSALPHYAPQRGKDRLIDPDTTYLIDSGAQYQDATIDTTRTFYFGSSPSPELKRAYTRVLQGHIAVSLAKFPTGMPGDRLGMLARKALYDDGLDFGHGVGHGIGSYLGVHENPMYSRSIAFEPGHITTIEPGYYKEGEWGIRIESVLLCKQVETPEDAEPSHFLEWERITQVPIQTSLVDWSLMAKYEMRWLNEHNKTVQEALEPLLQGDEDAGAREWLTKACKPHKIWPWDGV
ncbi:cytoplasmic protein [Cryptococcus deuterogattii R265]|uniref:cytoplasmic protein n=1 Tax=Cryptococcus deuterogattii (strain R265) TaxID=294750 RepID=UPI001938A4BA|nr:cytoplasmic protein [Cryptococcus deuterogattii R265]